MSFVQRSRVITLNRLNDASTSAVLSGIKSSVRIEDDRGNFEVSNEWLVLGENESDHFAKQGDSGSLVFLESSRTVVGMLLAGTRELPWMAFVTSIEDIVEDIKTTLHATTCRLA